MQVTEEGIFYDISNEDYHSGPGISSSELKLALENMAEWKRKYVDGEQDASKDYFVIGSALHTAVLEPDEFEERYADDKVVKKNLDMITGMAESIRKHPEAGAIFNGKGIAEFSCYQTCPYTGLTRKVRPDYYREDIPNILFDLKSAQSASLDGFSRQMGNLKYFISAAYYLDVSRQFLPGLEKFVFVVVEKKPPYYVAVYPLADDAIALGRMCYLEGLELIKQGQEKRWYPGYNKDAVVEIDVPRYIYTQMTSKFDSSF
jgi:hypothetical protein